MTQAANLAALASNGSLQLPSWTTGTRPTGVNGLSGYNTTLGQFEVYQNGAWTQYNTLYAIEYLTVAGGGGGGSSDGAANTGGGGGGGNSGNTGKNGGGGIAIIRYAGSQRGTGGDVSTSGGYTYHTFTSSGTYTA